MHLVPACPAAAFRGVRSFYEFDVMTDAFVRAVSYARHLAIAERLHKNAVVGEGSLLAVECFFFPV